MPKQNNWCDIPELDLSDINKEYTDEEYAEIEAQIEHDSRPEKLRELIADIETHPEHLLGWDMDISFDEFAHKVKAGDHTWKTRSN